MSVKGVVVVTLVVLMWLTESSPTTVDREEDSIRSSSQQEDHPTVPPSWEVLFDTIRSIVAAKVNTVNEKKYMRFG